MILVVIAQTDSISKNSSSIVEINTSKYLKPSIHVQMRNEAILATFKNLTYTCC
jgi:hypothetical protein